MKMDLKFFRNLGKIRPKKVFRLLVIGRLQNRCNEALFCLFLVTFFFFFFLPTSKICDTCIWLLEPDQIQSMVVEIGQMFFGKKSFIDSIDPTILAAI